MSNLGTTLKSFVDRIEKLEAEKQTYVEDIRTVYKEAKDNDLNVKVVRAIVKMRKQDAAKRKEFEDELDAYMASLGMV